MVRSEPSHNLEDVLKVLFSRRMLAFHALVVLLVPAFIWLGFWQLDRAGQRASAVDLQRGNLAAEPVSVDEIASVDEPVSRDDRWRTIEATGTWDTDHQLLLRNRDGSQGVGFHVLTPLITEDGTGLLVNRGWIERGETAQDTPEIPEVPEGTVELTGRLQIGETEENTGLHGRDGLPEGQIMIVDVEELSDELPYPIYDGYMELTGQDPAPEFVPEYVELREEDSGMSASYAVQWWVFSVVAVIGWIVLIRRELRDARQEDSEGDGALTNGDTGGGPAGEASGVDEEEQVPRTRT